MRTVIALFALLALSVIPPASGEVIIDGFTDAYPPNPDLPTAGYTIIFVGSRCDGSACPPGTIVSNLVDDVADQSALGGVLGGNRVATITYVTGSANSNIAPSFPANTHNHNAGASSTLELHYGASADLDANLAIGGEDALEVLIFGGDLSAGPRPVPCTITVTSGRGTTSEATASATQNLVDNASYVFPFSFFPGVDFTDVDEIHYLFDASAVTSVDYAIGPLRSFNAAVPSAEKSWGSVKARYR